MPRSNLVKSSRTLGNVLQDSVSRFLWCGGPQSGQTSLVKPHSNLVKLGQPWSNLVKRFGPHLEVILMRRALDGSGWLSSGCLVLHANTRENLGGKNRVMTVALSLFGVSWHKERRTKNKWLDFCPLGFSRFSCPSSGTAKILSQFACHSLSDVLILNRLTHGSKVEGGFQILGFLPKLHFSYFCFFF